MEKWWNRLYNSLNSLSIPLIFGSCIALTFFSNFAGIHLPWTIYTLLSLSIFIIYSIDHLLDIIGNKNRSEIGRYQYHLKNRKIIILSLAIASVFILYLLFKVDVKVVKFGLLICIMTLFYFWMVHLIPNKKLASYLKEPMIALVYSAVIVLLPSLYGTQTLFSYMSLLHLDFLMVCILNLLVFTFYDYGIDKRTQMPSWLMGNSKGLIKKRIYYLTFLILALSIIFYLISPIYTAKYLLMFVLMKINLIYILYNEQYFSYKERHRWWGDAVFIWMLLFLA